MNRVLIFFNILMISLTNTYASPPVLVNGTMYGYSIELTGNSSQEVHDFQGSHNGYPFNFSLRNIGKIKRRINFKSSFHGSVKFITTVVAGRTRKIERTLTPFQGIDISYDSLAYKIKGFMFDNIYDFSVSIGEKEWKYSGIILNDLVELKLTKNNYGYTFLGYISGYLVDFDIIDKKNVLNQDELFSLILLLLLNADEDDLE